MLFPWSLAIDPVLYSAGGKNDGPYQLFALYPFSKEATRKIITISATNPNILLTPEGSFSPTVKIEMNRKPIPLSRTLMITPSAPYCSLF